MFKKKQAKKLIFDPKIALRTEPSDPALNSYFSADFLSARFQCSRLLRNCGNIKLLYGRGGMAQTIGPNCSMTHCPGKIEYNCCYFIMSFRTQIHKKKFDKKCFRKLQGTMSHRPLTNTSSLKIAAAYWRCRSWMCTLCRSRRKSFKRGFAGGETTIQLRNASSVSHD